MKAKERPGRSGVEGATVDVSQAERLQIELECNTRDRELIVTEMLSLRVSMPIPAHAGPQRWLASSSGAGCRVRGRVSVSQEPGARR